MIDAFQRKYSVKGNDLLELIKECLNGLKPEERPDAEHTRKRLERKLQTIWDPCDLRVHSRQLKVCSFMDLGHIYNGRQPFIKLHVAAFIDNKMTLLH